MFNLKGRGLFVFSDPGGAKPILALLALYKVSTFRVISDRNYDFYKEFSVKVEKYKENYSEIIFNYNPDYLFTSTSYTSKIELLFISEAKNNNIKTFTFIDHYTSFKERFNLHGKYIIPDKIFVTDQKAKRLAEHDNLSLNSSIEISGNFYHEYLKYWKPNLTRNSLFPKILSEQKLLLFAPDPLSNLKSENKFLFDETDVWKELSIALKSINNKNIVLVSKFHPNQNLKQISKTIKKFPIQNSIVNSSIDTNYLIYFSDIVIGMYSSLLVEAKIFEKKILRHVPNSETKDPLFHLNIGKKSFNADQLANNIRTYLQ